MSSPRKEVLQHRGAMMPLPAGGLVQHRDGYRTPTIEDPEHPANWWNRGHSLSTAFHFHHDGHHARPHSRPHTLRSNHQGKNHHTETDHNSQKMVLSWRKRMKHVTWAFFTLTMATGGIANVLSNVPFRFRGLEAIGSIFFLLNIVLYLIIWAMILTRFYLYPYTFKASFTHPTESLFVPAVAVSFGTILINVVEYGFGHTGHWLNRAVIVLFWFDAALAVVLSILIYMILWSTQSFTISRMTPIWIFPAYPLLIIGPHAGNLSARITNPSHALTVIVGGFTIQGVGFLVSLTIYSAFVYRLMTQKLPPETLRPGMFVSVGPSAFTVSGTINMAANLHKAIPASSTYMGAPGYLVASILTVVGNWMCLWLWGLAIWFFFVSVCSHWSILFVRGHKMDFQMTWFSFIFPQTALTTATFAVGRAFQVFSIQVVGCVMAGLLIIVWVLVVGAMIRAVYKKQILWPEQGEDKAGEGGFFFQNLDDHTTTSGDCGEGIDSGMAENAGGLVKEVDIESGTVNGNGTMRRT